MLRGAFSSRHILWHHWLTQAAYQRKTLGSGRGLGNQGKAPSPEHICALHWVVPTTHCGKSFFVFYRVVVAANPEAKSLFLDPDLVQLLRRVTWMLQGLPG